MIWFNRLEERIQSPNVIYWKRKREAALFSMELTIEQAPIEKGYRFIHDSHEYIIQGIEEVHDESLRMEIYAESSITELKGEPIFDKRPNDINAALTAITEVSRFEVGTYEAVTGSTNFYRMSAFDALQKLCKDFDCEYKVRYDIGVTGINHRYIDIFHRLGEDNGKRSTYTKDLQSIKRIVHDAPVITRLIPYGKGEKLENGYSRRIDISSVNDGLVYLDKSVENWGVAGTRPVAKISFFDDIDDPQVLKEAGQAELDALSAPQVTYSGDTVDLKSLGFVHEGVDLGDTVTIIDKEFEPELYVKARVIKLEEDSDNEVKIELGNYLPSITDTIAYQESILETVSGRSAIWDNAAVGDIPASRVQNLINEINAKLNATGGYVFLRENEGIEILDKPTVEEATQSIFLGGGYWRISNEKDANGNWIYRTLATGDGLVGSEILANSITANKLAADVGQSLDLSSNQSISLKVTSEVTEQLSDPDIQEQFKGEPGADGKSIGTVTAHYYLSTSPSVLSEGSWSTTYPGWVSGEYLWTKTVTTYSDDTTTETEPVNVTGMKGDDGRGIQDAYPQYYLSTSRTSQEGGSWQSTMPTWLEGLYIWTRMAIVLTNPTEKKYTDPTLHTELEEIHSRITTHQAEIEVNKTNITSLVSETEAIETNLGSQITELSNTVTQNHSSTTENYGRLVTRITETETEIEDINSYIQRGVDDDMNPQIIMGRSDQDKRWVWNYEAGMYIEDGGVVTFEASDQQVKTTRLVVLQSIDFGNHVAQKYGDKYTIFLPSGG